MQLQSIYALKMPVMAEYKVTTFESLSGYDSVCYRN